MRRRSTVLVVIVVLLVALVFLALMMGVFWLLGTIPLGLFFLAAIVYFVFSSFDHNKRSAATPPATEDEPQRPPEGAKL